MARKNKVEKINDIEEQIRKLQEEKEKTLERVERKIGKAVIKEWQTYDEEKILEFVKSISYEAQVFINGVNSESVNQDANNNQQSETNNND